MLKAGSRCEEGFNWKFKSLTILVININHYDLSLLVRSFVTRLIVKLSEGVYIVN